MAGAVQFYGKEQVLEAFSNMENCAWAIFHSGRNLFMKYEGSNADESNQLIVQALELLEKNSSDGIYTIKFFEVNTGGKVKINERSVCDGGSFNFKMITPELREQKQVGYINAVQTIQYEKKIWELEQKLKDATAEEKPMGIGDVALDLLKNPEQLGQLINIGRSILGFEPKGFGAIAGITNGSEMPGENSSMENQAEILANAIDTLSVADPDLIKHMQKLAQLAKTDPSKFKQSLGVIDML